MRKDGKRPILLRKSRPPAVRKETGTGNSAAAVTMNESANGNDNRLPLRPEREPDKKAGQSSGAGN